MRKSTKELKQEIYTDNLPHTGGKVSWKESINYDIGFDCNGIKGTLKLLSYNTKGGDMEVLYNNEVFKINVSSLSKCRLSRILGIKTPVHKYKIGDIVNKKLRITNFIRNKNNVKSYEYECLECGNKDSLTEGMIALGCSCNTCCPNPQKIEFGINSLVDTNPDIVKYLANKEDAKIYSKGTHKKIEWVCKDCGQHKMLAPNTFIKQGIMCDKCSDGKSFPNKLMFSVLQQLSINFENEKLFKWCKFKRYNSEKEQVGYYDFYFKLDNKEYIVEMDGELGHGKNTTFTTLEETNYIDDIKDKLAKEHNIEVIRIHCPDRFEVIKQNILDSNLKHLIDLTNIEWDKCVEYSSHSLVFKAIDSYNKGETLNKISETMKICKPTIRKYLRLGKEMNICNFESEEDMEKKNSILREEKRRIYSKEIICLENSEIFSSLHDCEDNSEERCGIRFSISGLCRVCNGKQDNTKGFHFKYTKDLSPQERILYKLDEEPQLTN